MEENKVMNDVLLTIVAFLIWIALPVYLLEKGPRLIKMSGTARVGNHKVAYALAFLVGIIIQQKIGGIVGLVVAVLAIIVLQMPFQFILAALGTTLRKGEERSSAENIDE